MADGDQPLKEYAVQLRCESTTFPPATDGTLILPPDETDAGKVQFRMRIEHRPGSDGRLVPKYLVFSTVLKGRDMQDAMNRANERVLLHASFISFLMNAYIGPAIPWTIYETGPTDSWRAARQAETEQRAPLSVRTTRKMDADVLDAFYRQPPPKVSDEHLQLLQRSIDLYGIALKHWNIFHSIFAAHYLFIAAEGLTDVAVPMYLARNNKTEGQLIEEIVPEVIHKYVPEDVKKSERTAIRADWKKRGYPSNLTGEAKSIIKSRARKEVIFEGYPEAYVALNKATNGLEHGFGDHNDFRGKAFTKQIENAAFCIRSWILCQLLTDQDLLAKLTSESFALPLVRLDPVIAANSEFKYGQKFVPRSDPCGALCELSVRFEGSEPVASAKPLFGEGVESRIIETTVSLPALTLSEQAEQFGPSMVQILGIKSY
jgi:hypothetical protein